MGVGVQVSGRVDVVFIFSIKYCLLCAMLVSMFAAISTTSMSFSHCIAGKVVPILNTVKTPEFLTTHPGTGLYGQ